MHESLGTHNRRSQIGTQTVESRDADYETNKNTCPPFRTNTPHKHRIKSLSPRETQWHASYI